MSEILDYYVGWDAHEVRAYEVCRRSAIRHSTKPLHIVPLREKALRFIGLYDRPWEIKDGQKIDSRDGKPFSTDFSFTRFLVPALNQYEGWALYTDCDFLWTADLAPLFEKADDQYAALVVKHLHIPKETDKMDGVVQTKYYRKNWSSLILWNCGHPSNKYLTVQAVNHEPGQWLHAFGWLRDEEIGELDLTWNWLSGVSEPTKPLTVEVEGIRVTSSRAFPPNAIHFTLGGPWFENCQEMPYAALWLEEEARGIRPLPSQIKAVLGT